MEKYGFIYIWFDRKHKRYYIGSHWGTEDDGYKCSSMWARNSMDRRPEDFKRRILKRIYTTRKDLYEEETRWLQMIKPEEIKVRYYNLQRVANHWVASEKDSLTIAEKISAANKKYYADPENRKKVSRATKNAMADQSVRDKLSASVKLAMENPLLRKKISETTSAAIILYYEQNSRTEKTRKKISANSKRLHREKKIGMHGKKHREETIDKMKINNAMHKEQNRQKIRDAKAGIRWLTNGVNKKMAVPNTEKWNMLISNNYAPIGQS